MLKKYKFEDVMAYRNSRHGPIKLIAFATLGMIAGCSGPTHRSYRIEDTAFTSNGELHYALPRVAIVVKATQAGGGVTIADPVPTYFPDPQARFSVRIDESIFAHDKFTLQVSNGLLETAKSENDDQTPEIIGTIVKIATEASKLVTIGRSDPKAQARSVAWSTDTVILTPFSATARIACRGRGQSAHYGIGCLSGLEVTAMQPDGSPLPVYGLHELAEIARRCEGSLCSRLLRPVRIMVRLAGRHVSEHLMMVPDPGLVVSHDIRRGPCINRVTTLSFTTGVLTKFDLDKPSELSECLKIPLSALEEITKSVTELLTFRISVIDNQTGLITAREKQIEALVKLAETQARLAGAAGQTEAARAASDARIAEARADTARSEGRLTSDRSTRASQTNQCLGAADRYCAKNASQEACLEEFRAACE